MKFSSSPPRRDDDPARWYECGLLGAEAGLLGLGILLLRRMRRRNGV
jgi:hypothetical protein